IACDETTNIKDVYDVVFAFEAGKRPQSVVMSASDYEEINRDGSYLIPLARQSTFLTHPVFNSYHSETEMLRYIKKLESRDLSLAHSMIPLGSCTMKLNGTSEMLPVTWPEFSRIHPFAPDDQTQ